MSQSQIAVSNKAISPRRQTGFAGLWATVAGFFLIALSLGLGAVQELMWWDDYAAMHYVKTGDPWLFNFVVSSGRPVSAVFQVLGFELAGEPRETWILRCLGVAAILLTFAILAWRWMGRRNGSLLIVSAGVAFCLPTFQIYAYWALVWEFPWGMVASVVGLLLWERSTDAGWKSIGCKAGGVAMVVLALLNYPPTAIFFLAVIAVEGVAFGQSSKVIARRFVGGLVMAVIATLVAAVLAVAMMKLTGNEPTSRVAVTKLADLPGKINWLVHEPVAATLRPFLIDNASNILAYLTIVPVIVILAIGLFRQSQRLLEFWGLRLIVVALPIAAGYGALVVVAENYFEYRFIPGAAWSVAVLALYAVACAVRTVFLRQHAASWRSLSLQRLAGVAIIFGSLLVGVFTVTNIRYYDIVKRSYDIKTNYLGTALADCRAEKRNSNIVLLEPAGEYPLATGLGPLGDGLGVGTFSMKTDMNQAWVPIPNVQDLDPLGLPVTLVERGSAQGQASLRDPSSCVIDLEPLRQLFMGNNA